MLPRVISHICIIHTYGITSMHSYMMYIDLSSPLRSVPPRPASRHYSPA